MTAGSNGFVRAIAVFSAIFAGLLASMPLALADARLCRQLEAELAGGAKTARTEKYDAAIAKQREQIVRVRNRARAAGCGFSMFGRAVEDCAKLNDNLARMESNLDALERKRGRVRPGRSQAQIIAAIDANGCRQAPQRIEAATENARAIERILSRTRATEQTAAEAGERKVQRVLNPGEGIGRLAGTYRTFCVRTCDGYYFPMSPASSRGQFTRDQKNCQAACPNAEMQLFYGEADGDTATEMISAQSSMPYSGLPAAFRYRSSATPEGCSCNAPRNFEIIAGNPPQQEAAEVQPAAAIAPTEAEPEFSASIVKPEPPAPAASVESVASPEAMATVAAGDEPAAIRDLDPDRKVRVVGPTFLPDPEEAINLRVPARRHGR
ncbi:DUF2865 domain-containing protein [Mesorhizobium sp. KR2-14]|uniref:DUF2865 domain-containing protein n=1 Tax=Mesorhizobium sp. KR2-14 TaxID=3156610 RepID=UPI0032B3F2EB